MSLLHLNVSCMFILQLVSELSIEDLGEMVYAWELPGVAGNAWNGEPGCSIAIGSGCIWDKFIFLATRRPGDCMEMLLECLRNPGTPRWMGESPGQSLSCHEMWHLSLGSGGNSFFPGVNMQAWTENENLEQRELEALEKID
eukprot:Gb_28252 [translate_table: standard]